MKTSPSSSGPGPSLELLVITAREPTPVVRLLHDVTVAGSGSDLRVMGWCPLRRAIRSFRVDRIRSATPIVVTREGRP